jgi:hypothetical protein
MFIRGLSPVNTITSAWPPMRLAQAFGVGGVDSIATGTRCAWRSQSRLFWIFGSVPGGASWPELTPNPMLRNPALQNFAGQHGEDDRHL